MLRLGGRYFFTVTAALGLASGLVGTGVAEAGSSPDLSIAVAGHPATVSPPGGVALYRLTVRNAVGKQTFSNVVVVHTMAAGFQFSRSLTGNGCSNPSGDGSTVACTIASLAPGASASFDVFAATPTTAGRYTSSASITASSPADNRRNNTAPAHTAVVLSDTETSGFFPPGAHRVGNQVLNVPSGGAKGVVGAMALEDSELLCKTECLFSGDAVRVDFPLQDPAYKVEDPLNPLTLQLDMGLLSPPCRGLGGTCDDLRFVDHLGTIGVVPFCDGASGTNAGPAHALPSAPCKYHQFKAADGRIHFEIALLSNDPTFF